MWHQNKNLKSEVRIFRMISGRFPNRIGRVASAAVSVGTVFRGARTDAESRFRYKQRMTPGSRLSISFSFGYNRQQTFQRARIVRKLELGRTESLKFENSYGDLLTCVLCINS